jgi:retinol dehydrogenase 12
MSKTASLNMSHRVAIVTGANTGIGLVTARELASAGTRVFVACRSLANAQSAVQQIQATTGNSTVEALQLDLGDFASIRACAGNFLARDLPLLERMQASAPARIVTVASRAHTRSAGLNWDACQQTTQSRLAIKEYADSKLANVLFSAELARRLSGTGVNTYALHPGVVASDIWRRIPWPFNALIKRGMITTEEGAETSLFCATATQLGAETGMYYDKSAVRAPSALGQNLNLAKELWQRSQEWAQI